MAWSNASLTEWRRIILALLMLTLLATQLPTPWRGTVIRHGLLGQRWKLRPGANYLDGCLRDNC